MNISLRASPLNVFSAPLKILYVDANYLMFYACYSGDSDKPCIKEAMEVTLTGRTREISEKEKKHIYKMLPQICVDPADMVDTEFAGTINKLQQNFNGSNTFGIMKISSRRG